MDSQQAIITWVFTCSHNLIQLHEHSNTGLGPTENAPGLCPSCNIQFLAVNAINKKDEDDLAVLKEQYTHLAAEIGRARAEGGMKYKDNIVELESTLEDLLDSYKIKLLATAEPKTDRLTENIRTELVNRYDEVQWNINMLLDLETLNLRRIRRNVEYEDCEFNEMDLGKFHYCHSQERTIVPEDQVLIHQRTVIREALKEARDGLHLWKKAFDQKKEIPENFEGAIEEWWGWVLKTSRGTI